MKIESGPSVDSRHMLSRPAPLSSFLGLIGWRCEMWSSLSRIFRLQNVDVKPLLNIRHKRVHDSVPGEEEMFAVWMVQEKEFDILKLCVKRFCIPVPHGYLHLLFSLMVFFFASSSTCSATNLIRRTDEGHTTNSDKITNTCLKEVYVRSGSRFSTTVADVPQWLCTFPQQLRRSFGR